MRIIILFFSVGIWVFGLSKAVAEGGEYKRFVVVSVADGDTIKGVVDYKYQTIRIAGIDCPENRVNAKVFEQIKLFGVGDKSELIEKGKQARVRLKKLLEFYEEEIYFVERSEMKCSYGNGKRLVGELYVGGINVGEYMIKEVGCVKMGCKKQ